VLSAEPSAIHLQGKQAGNRRPGACLPGTAASPYPGPAGADHPVRYPTDDRPARACPLTGKAGDAAAARDQYAELLPVSERVLGPKHPHVLADRSHLTYWTKKAGDSSRG
jgi:hypothetical protein